jgi:hypothetical protein
MRRENISPNVAGLPLCADRFIAGQAINVLQNQTRPRGALRLMEAFFRPPARKTEWWKHPSRRIVSKQQYLHTLPGVQNRGPWERYVIPWLVSCANP